MTMPHQLILRSGAAGLSRRAGRMFWLALLTAGTLTACGNLPSPTSLPQANARADVPAGIVSVTYTDSARFSEASANPREGAKTRQVWLDELCVHLSERAAAALAPGQRLEVQLTDVRRAGRFEPLRGPQGSDVRIVRDIYPPLIDLGFKLLAADGRVLRQGQRQLRDLDFMARSSRNSNDPLRYEKTLADDWVAKEFKPGT